MKNIVIIIMDAVRAKNLSLYGYHKETDKNLKKLANKSIVFTNHFSCSNFTFPSLISLFTGKYPDNHGMIHQFPYYEPEEMKKFKENKFWFPSYLKQKGYSTIGIGWPGLWLKKDFDYYQEKEIIAEENKKPEKFLKNFLNKPLTKRVLLNLPGWAYKFGKKITKTRTSAKFPMVDETIDLAIKKIKESKKPFFEFIHIQDTHLPFRTLEKIKPLKKDYKKILKKIKNKSQKEYIKKRFTDIGLYSIDEVVNKYDSAIKNVDEQLGKFIDFLKKENLWNNTIFVILSDHGFSFYEHEIYLSSAGLYNTTLHIPLIMHIPGFESRRVERFVQNIDIVPTLLDLLGKNKIEGIDGISILPLMEKEIPIRKKIIAFDGLAKDIKSVQIGKRKKIIAKDSLCYLCKSRHHKEIEEYNLDEDPEELNNICPEK